MENLIPPQLVLTPEHEETIAMLSTNVGSNEYCYSHSFNVGTKDGEKAPAPIEIFYKLMDGMPTFLKNALDFNSSAGRQLGIQQFRDRSHLTIGHVIVSGFSNDCINLRDTHDRNYYIVGSIQSHQAAELDNGEYRDEQVEVCFRLIGRNFLTRKLIFIAKPILRLVVPRIMKKIFAMIGGSEQEKALETQEQKTSHY